MFESNVCDDEWKGMYDICVDTSAADPFVDQAIAYNLFVTDEYI